jgi:hypothetical protein
VISGPASAGCDRAGVRSRGRNGSRKGPMIMRTSSRMRIVGTDQGAWRGAFALLSLVAAAGCGGSLDDDGSGSSTSSSTGAGSEAGSSSTGSGGAGAGGSGSGGADLCAGIVCTASDACHIAGSCDPATGMCSNPSAANGTACDDNDLCTQTDTCQFGACLGANPVACSGGDECHMDATCNPATGTCTNPPAVPDGTLCGTCGACTSGVCGTKVLGKSETGPGTAQPMSIAVDADKLYFGNAYAGFTGLANLSSMPKGGAPQATPIATGFSGYPHLVRSGADIYFIDINALWKVAADGSSMATQIAPVAGGGWVAADNLNVYVTRYASGDVMSYPLGGGMPATIAAGESGPSIIVTDGINLYWIATTAIRQKAISGGPIATVASNQQTPSDLAVDATSVYWTDSLAGTVNKAPIGGGAITTLASGQSKPRGLTITATTVYWTNYADGANGNVAKTSIAGGGPITIIPASGSYGTGPASMAHDTECVYWVEHGFARVLSAPL